MSKKHDCTRENLLGARKARDFQRVAQSHPAWLRHEAGKGDHQFEVYETPNGELRNLWSESHGEVSVGVRHEFVRRLIRYGLLVIVAVSAVIIFR